MLLKLLRLLKGYVIFIAKGGFGERFINLCAGRRIDIWDVSYTEGAIKGKISIKDFSKLRNVARKTGVRIKIQRKRGLPFYLKAHSNRKGLIIGAVFFIVFSLIMNRFVWCINVTDSEKFSREQIIEAALNAGLHYGVYVSAFDEEKAAREIYKYFGGELSYVKVNIKGSLAAIEFRDSKEKLNIEEKGEPSNIIADFDGVIVSDETYQGAKNISKGNAVKKGDILISGIVEGVDRKPLYYEAKGNFTALHDSYSELITNCSEKAGSFYDIKEYYKIILFGIEIPLGFVSCPDENAKLFSYKKMAEYGGCVLPFGIEKNTVAFWRKTEITEEHTEKLACMNYSNMVYDKYKNSNIVSGNVTVKTQNSKVIISGDYKCIDFIGENKPLIIEKTENY